MAGEDSMARDQRQRRRTLYGALLIAALLASAILTFFLDDLLRTFDRTYTIHLIMPGVAGLVRDAPVWVSGREVGTVEAVGLLPMEQDTSARVLLTVILPRDVQSQVRTDSEVRLTSISFASGKVVDIAAGTAAGDVLESGDTLRHYSRPTARQLTARAATLRRELDSTLVELRSHAPAVRARLMEVDHAMAGLDRMVAELVQLQQNVDASPGLALLRGPEFRASLDRTRAHTTQLRTMIADLRQPQAAAEVRDALARLQTRADSLNARIVAAGAALDNPNGTLARLQQDSALVRAIGAARAELDSLIADVRRKPLRFVY